MASADGGVIVSPLASLLAPRSVAVIGASADRHKIRGALLHLLRKNGFPGRIVPVNPSAAEIDGLRCYPSLADAGGEPIDVALIAIPAAAVLAALEDCAAAGVRFAVIISSGFAEDDAAPPDLQDRVAALARRTGLRIVGPNAEGFHNEIASVSATFSPAVDREADDNPTATQARIGIIAQSGGMGFALYNRGRALGMAFSTVISTGNEADLTAADFLGHMVMDRDTRGILLFLESVRDGALFIAAAEAARAAGKFIVAIKIGRSAVGTLAAASHTASMAGWDAGYDAMFRHCGIHVASELDEALTIAAALPSNPPAQGRRIGVLTLSGGAGAWSADILTAAGLELPELGAATQATIRTFIPSYGTTRNPVDLTAGGTQGGGMLRAIRLLSEDDGIDQIAVITTLANPARVSLEIEALRTLLAERRKPVLFYSYTLPSPLGRKALADAGAVICPSMEALAAVARALAECVPATPAPDEPEIVLAERAWTHLAGRTGALAEHEAKAILATCGVCVSPGRLIRTVDELDEAAAHLGFPLAAKIQSRDLPHKTEAGGVRLGIADPATLRAAFCDIMATATAHAPGAAIDGVFLERMAPAGIEMIVGIVRDPVFGPVVMVGAGGVAAELFDDTAHRLAPLDETEAIAMLRGLRSARLLDGFRGAPPADIASFGHLVSEISRIAVAGRAVIAELELNPVIVHPAGQGCTIADALMTLIPADPPGDTRA